MGKHVRQMDTKTLDNLPIEQYRPPKRDVFFSATRVMGGVRDTRIRLTLIFSEAKDGNYTRRSVFEEVVSPDEAHALVTALRDQADAELQRLFPEEQVGGRHRG